MEKIINYEDFRRFAYVNDKICKRPIKSIIISFFGLGGAAMYGNDTTDGEFYAEHGFLYLVPYNNPWAWMNKQALAYTDELVDVLIEALNLKKDIPIISTGGSMGGQSALVYTAYSRHNVVSCVVNCPVCDMVFHYDEREDLPRTIYSALFNEKCSLDEALRSISPLHLLHKMPRVKYHIFHCDSDMAVNINVHSEKLVAAMRKEGFDVTYDVVNGRGHCDLSLAAKRKFSEYVLDSVE